ALGWLLGNTALQNGAWLAVSLLMLAILAVETVRTLARREAGIDLLALLAIAGAVLLQEYLAGAVIAVMLASGRALEEYAAGRARRELSALLARAPRITHRFEDGELVEIPVAQVRPGDRLLVRPRSEEHTSELQSRENLVCRLLLEKHNKHAGDAHRPGTSDALIRQGTS